MALCEGKLDSVMHLAREGSSSSEDKESPEKKPKLERNGDIYGLDAVPPLPLSVDYRSPVSHFIPPAVELYASRNKPEMNVAAETAVTPPPVKRKRGRPRIDKTSPEYLANLAARKQAREMAAVMNNRPDTGEKRKRGRPRVDKTSPEYLARKRAREIEALEKKAKREYRRRATGGIIVKQNNVISNNTTLRVVKKVPAKGNPTGQPLRKVPQKVQQKMPQKMQQKLQQKSQQKVPQKLQQRAQKLPQRPLPQKGGVVRKMGDKKIIIRRNSKFIKRKDSAASSSTGDTTPRVKRKYTKRTPSAKKNDPNTPDRVKGKRGRPRKTDQMAAGSKQQPKIRVGTNLMPLNQEPISLDSDDEPDLGSPGQASDSLSLDENLRAIRHIHEKYANIDKDDLYEAHLLAANFKKPPMDQVQRLKQDDDEVLSVRSSDGASVKELDTRVEKLEDSDSDSGSSSSGSTSSGSSSSSSSGSSSSSNSTDSDTDSADDAADGDDAPRPAGNDNSFGAWSYAGTNQSGTISVSGSGSDSDPERDRSDMPAPSLQDDISESDNESPDKIFQCHICRKWYSTKVNLKIHRRIHQNKGGGNSRSRTRSTDRYECDCCNATFNRREKLWEHKAEAHRGAMTVRCEVCRKCFEDEAELAAHDGNHTADERAGRCSECGATFARYEQLRRHRACAHSATPPAARLPHACSQCGKRFGHAHSLTRHMHNHARQLYRCVVCKASFVRADQLAQHLNSHLADYKRLKQ
ncbi:uncharacterized protein [Epargyreus clarus]|uniref:uncharacterized protein n=1 Tax=Epargyreus clarus TaxID=520877 RepID=UPI003C2C31DF